MAARFGLLARWLIAGLVVDALILPAGVATLHHAIPASAPWTTWLPWATWPRAVVWSHGLLLGGGIVLAVAVWIGLLQSLSPGGQATAGTQGSRTGGHVYGSARWRTPAEWDQTAVRWPESAAAGQRRLAHAAQRGEPTTPAAGLVLGTPTARPAPPKDGRPGFTAWVLHRDENALILGPTRSGKSRRVLLPTLGVLGTAGESMVVNDPKGELCDATAAWLHTRGYVVVRGDLRTPEHGYVWQPHTDRPDQPFRWNLLAPARRAWAAGEETAAGQWVDDIVQGLLTTQLGAGGDDRNAYWQKVAQSALSGLLLGLLDAAPEDACHLPGLQHLLGLPDADLDAWFAAMPPTALAAQLARTYLKTQGEARTTANSYTLGYLQSLTAPAIQWLLSGATFDPQQCVTGRAPVALFLVIPEQRKTLDPLVTLMIQQLLQGVSEDAARLPNRRLPIRLNLILDEFGQLPPIPAFDKAVSVGLSRGIRLVLALQDLGQLQRYDEAARRTILGNCGTWLCLGTDDLDTAQQISQRMGQYDRAFTTRQHSASGSAGPVQTSWGQQTVGRSLLTADEIMRWPAGQALILQQRQHAGRTWVPDWTVWGFAWNVAPPVPTSPLARPRLWPDPTQNERVPGAPVVEEPAPDGWTPSPEAESPAVDEELIVMDETTEFETLPW